MQGVGLVLREIDVELLTQDFQDLLDSGGDLAVRRVQRQVGRAGKASDLACDLPRLEHEVDAAGVDGAVRHA